MNFADVAPYLGNPLVLIGFALLLVFGVHRALIRSGIIPPLRKQDAPQVVRAVLRYGFLIALALIGAGFGLAAWKIRAASHTVRELTRLDAETLIQRSRGSIERCLAPNRAVTFLNFVFSLRPDGGLNVDVRSGTKAMTELEWVHLPPAAASSTGDKLSVTKPDQNACLISLIEDSLRSYNALPDNEPFAHLYITDFGLQVARDNPRSP